MDLKNIVKISVLINESYYSDLIEVSILIELCMFRIILAKVYNTEH